MPRNLDALALKQGAFQRDLDDPRHGKGERVPDARLQVRAVPTSANRGRAGLPKGATTMSARKIGVP
jgi:hypothetical protein